MSKTRETFFTVIGCMDGRCQEAVALYGQKRFGAEFPDAITEAGLVGLLAKEDVDQSLLASLKKKIDISLKNHHSKGILVYGHAECAGNPVDDNTHKDNIHAAVHVIQSLVDNKEIPVVPLFVERSGKNDLATWEAHEVHHHEHHGN